MADSTVVLITGVSRGIGRTFVETYLLRPNHIVIGSVRDKTAPYVQELESLSVAKGSRLVLIKIESASFTDPAEAIKDLEADGIDHIDMVIANAGGSGEKPFIPLDIVGADNVTDVFNVNTLGPLVLHQAILPFLQKSKAPKWVSVTSAAGSIGKLDAFQAHVVPAYGIAKAGLNWMTVLVQTDPGNSAAKAMGLEQAPTTKQQSIDAIISLIDNATREKTSGKFHDVIGGTEIPW
ncbi:NAD(P)-binding protein [Lipomyces kononenkoae]|uniref:NAD(P)-binding protein n=1 Tax=Lipomyces kononenkoae TaxID=34357 RepID=A0ACC3SW29_LIPKO